MHTEPHDLKHEFPEFRDKIQTLKTNNAHFARLLDEYRQADQEILRIEDGIENTSDTYAEDLKKTRLSLKDALYAMLRAPD